MKIPIAVLLLALVTAFCSAVQATALDDLGKAPVSMVEFGSFKLEIALVSIRDWPVPIEGVSVSYRIDPDQIEIVVVLKKVPPESFRTACAQTLGRVREFLYLDAQGVAPMGRSHLISYFRGPARGSARETASHAIDASTQIWVNVVGLGSCHAALLKAPITYEATSTR